MTTASPKTVLVVDDDKGYCEIVRDTLEGAGFRVLVASHALEALRINRTHPERIHLALIDVAMPLMDGWALAEHLWKKRPVRLLLMSGQRILRAEGGHHARRRIAFIEKPTTSAALLSAVRAALETA
jgi:DNA-binding NtrC family response regulator